MGNSSAFEQFRELVFQDLSLQIQLREARDLATLSALAVRLGRQQGLHFHESDVAEANREATRQWIERAVSE